MEKKECTYVFPQNLPILKQMDGEMEDFSVECLNVYPEIDWEYEFDAAWFYDFCRPESPSEAAEAERWFQTAGNYPPSRKS